MGAQWSATLLCRSCREAWERATSRHGRTEATDQWWYRAHLRNRQRWAHWFELAPHVVSSWHVPVLPGKYGNEEWQAIASLLGIQTTAVGGFMYFLHK